MTKSEALIFGLLLSNDGVIEINWDELTGDVIDPGMRRWLHFSRFSQEAREWLISSKTVSQLVCDVLFQEETRPRAFAHDGGVVVNLRSVNLNEGAVAEDLISLRMFATDALLITTRAHPVKSVEDLRELVTSGDGPTSNGAILTFLADSLTGRLEPVVQRLEDAVDALESDMLDESTPPPKLAVANFRRAVLTLRRYIAPQREAISGLAREGGTLLSADDRLYLRETQDTVFRLAEHLDMIRERALVLQEQIVEIRAEAMNQRLFVLAIISAIFLPLGFVTGLFGVNVGGVLGIESPNAFVILCLGMIALVGILLLLFKKMKWL